MNTPKEVRQRKAEDYANTRIVPGFSGEDRELVREFMEDAFKAGWDAAPKPVGYLR